MIRLKYVPDGIVFINATYAKKYDDFVNDCKKLKLTNPITKGEYFLFTPSRGVEEIEGKDLERLGNHGPADGKPEAYPEFHEIINRVKDFESLK